MTKTHSFTFPVYSFRHIDSPLNDVEMRDYYAFVKVRDLPDLASWRRINVRDAKLKGSVPTKIRNGLHDHPDLFMIMNRGIVISAESVKYDNKSNTVSVELADPILHGLLDGGHTYDIVRSEVSKNGDESKDPYVKVEFLTGFNKDDIEDVVEARNTSNQVKDESLMNLAGDFDDLKKALSGTRFLKKIAFKEYELDEESGNPKPIDVREVLAILTVFDKDNFDDKVHPINAYRSKVAVLNHFKDNSASYKKIYPLAAEMLELYDQIQLQLPELYNKATGGRFGKLTGVAYDKDRAKYELVYINGKSKYGVPTGFIYPILGAFRAILEEVDGKYRWAKRLDPFKLLGSDLGLSLATTLGSFARDQQNPSKTGKFAPVWQSCYQTAELTYFKASAR